MNIFYTNQSGKINKNNKFKYLSLKDILKKSDFISLHLPDQNNKEILSKKEFNLMKKGSYLINTSRGSLINELDLIDALNNKQIKAAALDVFRNEANINKEIYTHKKISLSQHIPEETIETKKNLAKSASKIIENFIKSYNKNNN